MPKYYSRRPNGSFQIQKQIDGERLSELRKENNLSQKKISEYLNLDPTDYLKIEENKIGLDVSVLDKLCLLYGCSPEYLLGESDEYNLIGITFNTDEVVDLDMIAKINETMNYLELLEKLNGG